LSPAHTAGLPAYGDTPHGTDYATDTAHYSQQTTPTHWQHTTHYSPLHHPALSHHMTWQHAASAHYDDVVGAVYIIGVVRCITVGWGRWCTAVGCGEGGVVW